jgi:hypothetical protein
MGFDLKGEEPKKVVPEQFKALCIGRVVRYVAAGYVRPGMVVDVLDQAAGVVELQVFWGANRGEAVPIDEKTGQAGIVRYDADQTLNTWHWPPRAG